MKNEILNLTIPDEIAEVMRKLEDCGYPAYLVGGCLRDALSGRKINDFDMASAATPDELRAVLDGYRVIPTGLKHGTLTVLTGSGIPIEITTFRCDGEYSDSRHPDSVTFSRDVKDDLSRRDFTVNAMAYSPARGLCDLFGGRSDLERGIIRAVGDPEKRFTEDALRIMRAFRFAAQLGFSIEEKTLGAAVALSPLLCRIARERIAVELKKLLSAQKPSGVLALMRQVFPHVLAGVTLPDDEKLKKFDGLKNDGILRLAALIYPAGEDEVLRISHELRLSNAEKKRLSHLAVRFDLAEADTDVSDADVRRLMAERGVTDTLDLLSITRPGLIPRAGAIAKENPPLSLADLALSGGELAALGICPDVEIGDVLKRLLSAVIADPSLNDRDVLIDMAKKY